MQLRMLRSVCSAARLMSKNRCTHAQFRSCLPSRAVASDAETSQVDDFDFGANVATVGQQGREWKDRPATFVQSQKGHATYAQQVLAARDSGNVIELDRLWRYQRRPNASTCSLTVAAYAALGELDKMDAVYKRMISRSQHSEAAFTSVLIAHSKAGNLARTEEIFADLGDVGLTPTLPMFGALMTAYHKACDFASVCRVHGDLRRMGYTPDQYVCNIIAAACRVADDIAPLETALEQMRISLFPSTPAGYNAAMRFYVRKNDAAGVERIWEAMKRARVRPDAGSHYARLHVYRRLQDVSGAERVWAELRAEGVQATTAMYNDLLNTVAQGGDEAGRARMQELFDEMKEREVARDSSSYWPMVGARSASPEERVQTLLDLYRGMDEDKVPLDTAAYNALFYALNKTGNSADQLQHWYERMQRDGVPPNQATFNTVLFGLSLTGDRAAMQRMTAQMFKAGFTLDVFGYNALIAGHSRARDYMRVWDLVREMESAQVVPDETTFDVILDAAGFAHSLKRVDSYWKTLCRVVTPRVNTYTSLLEAYARCGRLDKAVGVFDRMSAAGLAPSLKTVGVFVHFCRKRGIKAFGLADEINRLQGLNYEAENMPAPDWLLEKALALPDLPKPRGPPVRRDATSEQDDSSSLGGLVA